MSGICEHIFETEFISDADAVMETEFVSEEEMVVETGFIADDQVFDGKFGTIVVAGVKAIDEVATKDSSNLITSGAVYNAAEERIRKSSIAKNTDIDKLFR